MIAEVIFYFATFTSVNPATLRDCEYRTGIPNAVAVYNTIRWDAQGWPLWGVTCLWRTT